MPGINIPPHIAYKLADQLAETYRYSDVTCAALEAESKQLRIIFSMYKAGFETISSGDPNMQELLKHMTLLLKHMENTEKILGSEAQMAKSVKQLLGEFNVK